MERVKFEWEKPPLAAWSLVTRPKKEGGLGVLNLTTQNDALLLKSLHKFFNKSDCPSVSLIWNNHYRNRKLPSSRLKGFLLVAISPKEIK